jgi:hypothetical protein
MTIDLREIDWECGVDSVGSGYGSVAGSFEHGDNLQLLAPLS